MSTVPASSSVMIAGIMLGFFSLCLVITFQAPLVWWIAPIVCAVVVAVIATLRIRRHRRMRRALHGAQL
jgi:membrane glycosyltransferase